MTESQCNILQIIAAVGRGWTRRQASVLLVGIAIALIAWLLAMVVVDNLAVLSSEALQVGWAVIGLVLLAWLVVNVYHLTFGRPTAHRFAMLYETRVGNQHNRLVNAYELLIGGRAERDPMAAAAVMENASRLEAAEARRAIDWTLVRRGMATMLVIAVALIGYSAARPTLASNAIQRIFSPLTPPPHWLSTQITVKPGNTTVVEGEGVIIEVELARRLPKHVTLEYCVGQLGWTSEPMDTIAKDHFRYERFVPVNQPIRYRVHAGVSRSEVYEINVMRRPVVTTLQAAVTLPTYAGGETTSLAANVGDISALLGASVRLTVAASKPLSSAAAVMSDGTRLEAVVDRSQPNVATIDMPVQSDTTYTLHLTDQDGLKNVQPRRYTLDTRPDAPPSVVIVQPGRDLIVPADVAVPLRVETRDDVGLTDLTLEVRTPRSAWRAHATREVGQPLITQAELDLSLDQPAMELSTDDTLLYRVVARDNRQPDANVSISRTWTLTVAKPLAGDTMMVQQRKRLLVLLAEALRLQKENRAAFAGNGPDLSVVRLKQKRVRSVTTEALDEQRKAMRPSAAIVRELSLLASGPMLSAVQLLDRYNDTEDEQKRVKPGLVGTIDHIIEQLEALIARVDRSVADAEAAAAAFEKMTPQERAKLIKRIHDQLKKLRAFKAEQDEVVKDIEELKKRGEDLTDDKQKLEQIKGIEDKWVKILKGNIKEIEELAKQDFADDTVANDYKEIVEQIEEASRKLGGEAKTISTGPEGEIKSAAERAEEILEEMEQWLPAGPDATKWVMENPAETPEVPNIALPEELFDVIGELIEEQDELNDAAKDETSAHATNSQEATWGVGGGPISSFAAQGKTGDQLPDANQASGRSGDGRASPGMGQMVEDVAKARGSGQESLQGDAPPPTYEGLREMKDWQKRIRQKGQRIAGQLKVLQIRIPELQQSLTLMQDAEKAADDGRYSDMLDRQRMIIGKLREAASLDARESYMRIDQAYALPVEHRQQTLDAIEEPVPAEYRDITQRYFEQLSESK